MVVVLSRTTTAKMTLIVGENNFAINKMWELITISHQWTQYTAKVLAMISLNVDTVQEYGNIDYTEL